MLCMPRRHALPYDAMYGPRGAGFSRASANHMLSCYVWFRPCIVGQCTRTSAKYAAAR